MSKPKSTSFGPVLDGIVLPDTIILPPEVLTLLPWMNLAELKVVLAALGRLMQVGVAEPISLTDFQQMTGLDRKSVLVGIKRAIKRGLLARHEISGYRGHKTFMYELKPAIGGNFIGGNFPPISPIKAKQSKVNVVDSEELTTTYFALLNLSAGENFSQKTGENAQKMALFERLHDVGVYAKTARFLLENFPHDRIEKCLEVYPLAVKAGRANGPGWLVSAISDPSWDMDAERADLLERLEAQERRAEATAADDRPDRARKPGLPRAVQEALRDIGWSGGTDELAGHYREDRKRFKAWLEWAKKQPREHAAARFLTGLRSGLLPPVDPSSGAGIRQRILEGQYAAFIEH